MHTLIFYFILFYALCFYKMSETKFVMEYVLFWKPSLFSHTSYMLIYEKHPIFPLFIYMLIFLKSSFCSIVKSADPAYFPIVQLSVLFADPASIMDLLDQMGESPVTNSGQFQQTMSEKMAINAIQKSLMQCETVVKGPTYPTNTVKFLSPIIYMPFICNDI